MLAGEMLGLGHGLAADYYSDSWLANLAATRIDSQVSFDWGTAAPMTALPADGFAVRWVGKVQAQYSETYTFYAQADADDGLRLTVYTADLTVAGGRKANVLADTWTRHTAAEQSGTLNLCAGETYDIALEYAHGSGTASVALRWSSPSTAKTAIPHAQLYPTQSLAVSAISGSWLNVDVGGPATAGSFSSQGSFYTIDGGGSGIGGTADQFQYACQVLQGDGVAVVKVDDFTGANLDAGAQVGLMVRDGISADAMYAGLFLTPGAGVRFSSRAAAGEAATTAGLAGVSAPYWLKLVRRGPTVNGYVSASGSDESWTFAGRADVRGFGDAVLIGVAATSSSSATVSATLSNVRMATDLELAGGLAHLTSYYPNLPFIDLIKCGAGVPMKLEANGSLSSTNTAASVDANGWPTEDFGYRGPYAQKPDALVGIPFTLTFTGAANVSVVSPSVGTATRASAATGDPDYTAGYNAATNTSRWYVTSSDASGGNGTGVSVRFQNTQRTAASATGTGVTNIQLLQPGYASYDSQHVFTKEWLDLIKPLKEIRLKDWAMVDGNLTVSWSQRTRPASPNQIALGGFNSPYGGVAWEYLVQIANLAHKDVWLSLPARADSDYIRRLAQLFRYGSDGVNPYTSPQANPVFPGLDPDLNVYLEYSNEVWNYVFDSNAYALGQAWAAYQAGARYGPNQVRLDYDGRVWTSQNNQDLLYRWIAAHLKQDLVDTWADVFGSPAVNTRIRPVLSGWLAYPDRTCEESLKFLQAAGWTPKDSLYAISVAGYYGYNDLATAQVAAASARDSATKEQTLDTFAAAATAVRGGVAWPVTSAIASAYGVKLVAYEAGPSIGGTNAQGAAQMDPEFVGVQNSIVNSWFASGGEQYNFSFILFLNSYGNSQGDFILGDNPWDRNQPRQQSLYELTTAGSTPPVIDGFTALPNGELEARNYVTAVNPGPYYTVQPYSWQATATYRYMVRSLEERDVDLRVSAAAAAAGDRIRLYVNSQWTQTYDYASAAARDPANNFLYTDTAPQTIHLKAGINLIDLVLTNVNDGAQPQNAKAQLNSLKFSPVGASLANTLPWVYGLPGYLQNTVSIVQSIAENATTNFYVDVQDQETPAVAGQASPFTVTAVSDNEALLPNDAAHVSATYGTSGNPSARWTLALRPAANSTGRANLTVKVADPSGLARTYVVALNVVPASPTASSVLATAADDGTVTVAWTNNSQVNPTFKIERSPVYTGAAWVQVGATGPTAPGSVTWIDRPPAGGSYYYRVTAIDAAGVTGNSLTANPIGTTYTYSPVAVPAQAPGGQGVGATSLLSGKTYFVSSTDTTGNGGGQTMYSAFDGTSQFFSFSSTTGNALAVTRLDPTAAIDTLNFYFPAGVSWQRMPAVSIYYSTTDFSAATQATALNASNYTRWGGSSYALCQSGVWPVTTLPDSLQLSTLCGLGIPTGVQSLLLVFDASAANPYLAEVQAFGASGAAAPTDAAWTSTWEQFAPGTFANYTGARVSLSWDNPNAATAATRFVVQRDTTSSFNTANLRTWATGVNATNFVNDRDDQAKAMSPYAATWASSRNTLLPGATTYYYRIGARQADGSVVYAAPLVVTTAAAGYPISSPTGLTATVVSSSRIDLSWQPVAGATGYKIEKSTRSDFRDANYAMAQVTGTSYSDPTLTPNSVWYYRIRAVGAGGDSDWATASGTTLPVGRAPTGLAAATDEGTIRLTWNRPTGKVLAYEVVRGTSPSELVPYRTYTLGADLVSVPAFADSGIPEGATYYYAVRGVAWSNTNPSQLLYTPYSETISATTPVRVRSASNLDVDGNGRADALTDGILILRYLFDPAGPWAYADALGTGATRTTRPAIKAFLDAGRTIPLDADGNGTPDALTDGILILRYLFDPAGPWNYADALGSEATRYSRAEIKVILDQYNPAMAAPVPSLTADLPIKAAELPPVAIEPFTTGTRAVDEVVRAWNEPATDTQLRAVAAWVQASRADEDGQSTDTWWSP